MKIQNAITREAAKLEFDYDSTTEFLYRQVHPAQDLELLKSIEFDVGLAPGLSLSFDAEHVLVYRAENERELAIEHKEFFDASSCCADWCGLVWELCLVTDHPTVPVEVISTGEKAYIQELAAALNGVIDKASQAMELVPGTVTVEDPAGGLYAVSCRLHGDDDDSVYHVRCTDESAAQAAALQQLYEEACCDQDPASPEYRPHYIITSQLIASPAH